jgi:hypothetical protein
LQDQKEIDSLKAEVAELKKHDIVAAEMRIDPGGLVILGTNESPPCKLTKIGDMVVCQ